MKYWKSQDGAKAEGLKPYGVLEDILDQEIQTSACEQVGCTDSL